MFLPFCKPALPRGCGKVVVRGVLPGLERGNRVCGLLPPDRLTDAGPHSFIPKHRTHHQACASQERGNRLTAKRPARDPRSIFGWLALWKRSQARWPSHTPCRVRDFSIPSFATPTVPRALRFGPAFTGPPVEVTTSSTVAQVPVLTRPFA